MKLSETPIEALESLSAEQVASILYGGCKEMLTEADVALILGGNPNHCGERAYRAAELWREGRVKTLIPCGAVDWDFDGERISECEYLTRILLAEGVPEEAILREDRSTTTKENMLYATILFNKAFGIRNVRRACIVTSAMHLQRAMAIAELFLPRSVEVVGCPASMPKDPALAVTTEHGRYFSMRELPLMKKMIAEGFMKDIEY